MPKDVSSSSEDEAGPDPNAEKSIKYKCPADFVSLSYKACSSTLTEHLSKRKSELWLIKAPTKFDPQCLKDVKLNLSGLQSVKVAGQTGSQQIFNILASPQSCPDMHLVTNSKSAGQIHLAPPFSGLLNISESYGCSDANELPLPLAAAPAPTIPPGLKLRFQPFGSKTPTLIKTEPDGLVAADDQEGRKKKKKKKKQIKTEPMEEQVYVKEEPVDEDQSESTTKKKKKKRKREREEEVEVKLERDTEPTDSFMDCGDGHVTKKKKRKERQEEVEVKLEKDTEPTDSLMDLGDGHVTTKKKKKKKSKTD